MEKNLGYSLKNFLKITNSTKNQLLKAMNELAKEKEEKLKFENQSTDTFISSMKGVDHAQSYNANMAKEVTPCKIRTSSVGSWTSISNHEEKSSQASSNIYTWNRKYRGCSEKENKHKSSKFNSMF